MESPAIIPTSDIAADEIFEFIYEDLKRIARQHLRRSEAHVTLSTTELVHESFLKLRASPRFTDRAHFFGSAARAMRQVLVDFARKLRSEKRGGFYRRISLTGVEAALEVQLDEMIALDAALEQLSAIDPRLTQIVELRFFAGLPEQEIADILGVTTRTVARGWLKARLILLRTLETSK
ncbi:MAG TPA: ECF-type sigma factor [Gemmatimonadaceae bacterium]|jgi:RNA polymerase sigma factor (TIGR02999 family)|nr:ECF-type sigma factor [Gemmatimonadaceae bacterium]